MKTNYKQLYHDLLKEFEQYKKQSISWSVLDFTTLSKDGWEITDEQAQDALEHMINKHDCNNGITWETVDYFYEMYGTEVEEGTESWREDEEY
jgi:hypothetical protein